MDRILSPGQLEPTMLRHPLEEVNGCNRAFGLNRMEERALLVTVTEMWNAIGSTGRRVLVGTLGIKANGN